MNLRRTRLVLVSLSLLLGACSSPTANGVLKKVGLVSTTTYYVPAQQFKTVQFDPPPEPGSDAQREDLATILAWQNKRTDADCGKANETANFTTDSFLGPKSPFPVPMPPEVKTFFEHLSSDLGDAVGNMKNRYKRPRPYKAYPGQAVPCIKKSWGYSYPSGHSTFSRVFADVMTDIVPERKDEFFKKADGIAQDRVIGGVHFPTDIAAGKVLGDRFHAELLGSEDYRRDIEKVKTFLVK